MSREQEMDRNEQATPYKLEQARKRGQLARSSDVTSLAVLVIALLVLQALLPGDLQAMAHAMARYLSLAPNRLDTTTSAHQALASVLLDGLRVLGPSLLCLVVGVVVVALIQARGLTFSTHPIRPDFTRLNPVQGFKKLLSVRLLYEAVKSTIKLLCLAGVAWLALKALVPDAMKLLSRPAQALLPLLLDHAGGLLAKLCMVLLFFALIDLLFVRWEFLRNLRMSKKEIEDEHKHREGDPRIKRRQRELRLQFLKSARAVRKVPEAQVVITNPTHVAVALRYEHGVTPAPVLLAKGTGMLAKEIRRQAQRSGVPIVHSPRLARALFKEVQQDSYVPEHWYPPVARILVWLRSLREAQAQAQAGLAGRTA
ncbi:EscU/YscU/HrcU family type III secretion system export apparatus switch protein [Roseateles sp. DB2]|uniref:EscU/YscU/HrcU family type III secretion system export apparatus switch protein n=1 Tax=Roseateles sp. DB2 TaxID=3453717 RepID=UPI003EEF95F8